MVRELDRSKAALGLPVMVSGVITFASPRVNGGFIVDDGDTGIYVATADATARGLPKPEQNFDGLMQVGMRVEVAGVTASGGFAPVIIPQRIRHLGTAALPPAKPVTVAELQSGRFDCERVRVVAVFQHVGFSERQIDAVQMELAAEGGHFVAYATNPAGFDPSQLVDARAELTGVALSFFNERAELVGARVQLHGIEDIVVQQPASASPFDAPEATFDSLLPFSPDAPWLHRRRLTGVVTVFCPGDYFYIQKEDRAVRVSTRDTTPLVPGDVVEVLGFVEVREYFAEIREAVFRKTGTAPVPLPQPITREAVLKYRTWLERPPGATHFDGKRVALKGRLEKVEAGETSSRRLSLDCDGHIVFATLANDAPREALDRLIPGSEVNVIGACQVQLSVGRPTLRNPVPTGFQLLVHSPSDVAVIRVPPWWTPQRLWLALGGTTAILAIALFWAWLLRRQVAQRSAELAAEIGARRHAEVEFDATLRERKRMAADLHDTLEQALTGLALQLEAVNLFGSSEPEKSRHHLHLARQFLSRSREDVRRSVWNLRAQGLEGRSLTEALKQMVTALADASAVENRCELEGTPITLPDFVAGNLLLLAQEAVTNALKHGKPRRINARMAFAENGVTLRVEDNGSGFVPDKAPGLNEGHFGLQGMRERVKRMGGNLLVQSEPGCGTTIIAHVPKSSFDATIER
jgi:signal transduction histidine kinase